MLIRLIIASVRKCSLVNLFSRRDSRKTKVETRRNNEIVFKKCGCGISLCTVQAALRATAKSTASTSEHQIANFEF